MERAKAGPVRTPLSSMDVIASKTSKQLKEQQLKEKRKSITVNQATRNPIRAVQMGCGPIGCGIAKLAASKSTIDVVGAIDLTHAGRNLREVAQTDELKGITISDNVGTTLEQIKPDVVLHATGSSLKQVYPQLEQLLSRGVNVVSTCEELSYPFFHQPELSAKLDAIAKQAGATVLATGINPGFLMDAWPIFMTGVCQEVKAVVGVRVQNAAHRRLPFQKKIGAGLSVEEFQRQADAGRIQHVGLPESVAMIAAGLQWQLEEVLETIEPVIAVKEVRSHELVVAKGEVAGVKQVACGTVAGEDAIKLEFRAYIGADDSYDTVYIKGVPELEVAIDGGVHGDLATASAIVNAIPQVVAAPPGLKTMKDIPLLATVR